MNLPDNLRSAALAWADALDALLEAARWHLSDDEIRALVDTKLQEPPPDREVESDG